MGIKKGVLLPLVLDMAVSNDPFPKKTRTAIAKVDMCVVLALSLAMVGFIRSVCPAATETLEVYVVESHYFTSSVVRSQIGFLPNL